MTLPFHPNQKKKFRGFSGAGKAFLAEGFSGPVFICLFQPFDV